MGKPYAFELNLLEEAYHWALRLNIDGLKESISNISHLPLICIGSGGAFTTATFAAMLHEKSFLNVAKAITPLVFGDTNLYREKAVLILSAGGGNPDVLGALKNAIAQEPRKIVVFCLTKDSPLSKLARKHRCIDLVELNLPWGKDGFLATNSLLVFNILLLRAYLEICSPKTQLPPTLQNLMGGDLVERTGLLKNQCSKLWERPYLIVLYGSSTSSAGVDIESKFTEAALGVTQIADYRNFAHGRHYWLAKHSETTAVVALTCKDDKALAEKTIKLFPEEIPVVQIETMFGGAFADLAMLVYGFYLAGFVGEARQIDPGRPGVPRFGSQIYRLNAFGKLRQARKSKAEKLEEIAICRKTQSTIECLRKNGSLAYWRSCYKDFLNDIQGQYFQAIVFDYDETLCDGKDRYNGINVEIAGHLQKLLKAGFIVGIATGRGKSVRIDLQNKLSTDLCSNIIIGYYNASVIGVCSDKSLPVTNDTVDGELSKIAEILLQNSTIQETCDITLRPTQITVEPKAKRRTESLWNAIQQIVYSSNSNECKVVRSSHSFDILPSYVSKTNLVDEIKRRGISTILCIGDKGNYPGNDYSLLSLPYSLSADEVSNDERSCWNLAPPSFRGVDATLDYLKSFSYTKKGVRFCRK